VTGYLGVHLLEALLARTRGSGVKVHCILRARDDSHAKERLRETVRKFGVEVELSRAPCHAGDLGHEHLGLEPGVYSQLGRQVGVVFHSGAEVHFLKPYSLLRDPNVEGTVEVILFCLRGPRKSLHYVSTLSLLGLEGTFATAEVMSLDEESPLTSPPFFHGGYTQTKWVSEEVVWMAGAEAGLEAAVYRPGVIGAHSSRDVVNGDDFLSMLLRASFGARVYPQFSHSSLIPYSTVDFVAESIVELSEKRIFGRAFHTVQTSVGLGEMVRGVEGLEGVEGRVWQEKCLEAFPGTLFSILITEEAHSGMDFVQLMEIAPRTLHSAHKTLGLLSREVRGGGVGEEEVKKLLRLVQAGVGSSGLKQIF
jgi:thioester reductase-like protein